MIPFGQISEGPFVGMITPFIAIVGVHFVCDIGGAIKVAGDSMYFPILNEERFLNPGPESSKSQGCPVGKLGSKVRISGLFHVITPIYPQYIRSVSIGETTR